MLWFSAQRDAHYLLLTLVLITLLRTILEGSVKFFAEISTARQIIVSALKLYYQRTQCTI